PAAAPLDAKTISTNPEMPLDDLPEALVGGSIDLGAIATEFLVLGIDPYPRKPGTQFQAPAGEDDAPRPFAALAALRKSKGGEGAVRGRLFWGAPPPRFVAPVPHRVCSALDAVGGAHGAAVVVPGAEQSLRHYPDIEFQLFGDRAVLEPLVNARPDLKS